MLIDKDAVTEVAEVLKPEDFYRQHHGTIYAAILELHERREPVDIVTVSEVLERLEQLEAVGGSAYLTSLINLTPVSYTHLRAHETTASISYAVFCL